METVFSIISVLIILVLFGYIEYKAWGFASRNSDYMAKKSPTEADANFETAMEISPDKKIKEHLEEESEYITFEPIKMPIHENTEITLLTKNPYWLYSYWHINDDTIKDFNNRYGEDSWKTCQSCLKLINLTHNKEYFIHINNFADSWYIKVGDQLVEWKVYYGKMVPEKGFIVLAESNITITPAAKPSDIFDPDWLPDDILWAGLYQKGYFTNISSEELLN